MAENSPPSEFSSLFRPGKTVSMAVDNIGSVAELAERSNTLLVTGCGSKVVYLKFGVTGAVSVTPADGIPVLPGTQVLYRVAEMNYFAACIEEVGSTSRISVTSGVGES